MYQCPECKEQYTEPDTFYSEAPKYMYLNDDAMCPHCDHWHDETEALAWRDEIVTCCSECGEECGEWNGLEAVSDCCKCHTYKITRGEI